ncbi:3-phosphoshikimate 1-carboxyvinyltransferase [hydrothermal vent metagenome]|uniref:3-phosphoshikimate 1-carboxyvinyltransferase n=1 Tax=hydrothermal vent metagenome TaxID=652676 RepID=A0A3B0TUR9_9ZZZZ
MAQIEYHDAETPWSALKGVKSIHLTPANAPIVAEIMVPGSKSVSNRALILAAMATGQTRLDGLLRSDDTWWCADALKRLGVGVEFDGTSAKISGIGRTRPKSGDLHVGSAGTIARFLPPMLAAGDKGKWKMSASKQMSTRPVGPLFEALRAGGAKIDCLEEENCFPAIIYGDSFSGGSLSMSGAVSSQFISGVLMGAAQAQKGVDLRVEGGIVQSEYVAITLDVMRHFGADIKATPDFTHFAVAPTGYVARDLLVEADASTATYFAALAALTRGRIVMKNLGMNTRQPDYGFLEILEKMGCVVERSDTATSVQMSGPLKGGFTINMRPLSDAALTLAALAPFADGPITIKGVAHIRHHECDRISAMCLSLSQLGIKVDEHEDGMTIYPGQPRFGVLETFEDHRMAMALSVLGIGGAGIELEEPGCVSKTCPSFFDQMAAIGIATKLIR